MNNHRGLPHPWVNQVHNLLQQSAEKDAMEAYHRHVIAIVKSSMKLLKRFVWDWPSEKDQGRPKPSLYTCFFAVDEGMENCREPRGSVKTAIEGARLHVRRTTSTGPREWAGITKASSHEIAEDLGRIMGELLVVTQPPYDFDELDAIERDLKRANVQEGFAKNMSKQCADWDNQDLHPASAQRVGPDWFAFQGRFAKEVHRKFPKICAKDLENLAANVEREFARIGATETQGEVEADCINWTELMTSPPLPASKIAEKVFQPLKVTEPFLRYQRKIQPFCYVTDDNAQKGEARYLHKMPDILPALKAWIEKRHKKEAKSAG